MKGMGKQSGFSLIELMMVVAIIGILTMVALPMYRSNIADGHRVAAQQLMLSIANKEQQYLLDARSYTDDLSAAGLNVAEDGWTCTAAGCENAHFTISVGGVCSAACDGTNFLVPPQFLVTAVAKATGKNAGEANMTVSQTGAKTGEHWR